MSTTLHFETHGNGIPFLFIHGLGASLQQTKSLLQPISNVRKILPDCPGHGDSPSGNTYSFDYFADELIRLMDHLKLEQFICGGISMGAGLTCNLMVRHPDRLLGAVLIRPAWLDQPNPENLAFLPELAKHILLENGEATFQELPAFQKLKKEIPNAATSVMGQFNRKQSNEVISDTLIAMAGDRPVKNLTDLNRYKSPCLIIGNESDPLHPMEFGIQLQKNIPDSVFEQVGPRYFNPDMHMEDVQKLLNRFLIKHF